MTMEYDGIIRLISMERELTQARINLLETRIKSLEDSLPSSIDACGLDPDLEEMMTDIMSKIVSISADIKREDAVVKKSRIKILKNALYINDVLVSKGMPMTTDIKYKIGASTEVIIHCFPEELIVEEGKDAN